MTRRGFVAGVALAAVCQGDAMAETAAAAADRSGRHPDCGWRAAALRADGQGPGGRADPRRQRQPERHDVSPGAGARPAPRGDRLRPARPRPERLAGKRRRDAGASGRVDARRAPPDRDRARDPHRPQLRRFGGAGLGARRAGDRGRPDAARRPVAGLAGRPGAVSRPARHPGHRRRCSPMRCRAWSRKASPRGRSARFSRRSRRRPGISRISGSSWC